jgi:hypothetical protein
MIKKIIGCMLLAAAASMASSAVYADVNTCYIDTNKNGSWDSGENYYTSLTDAVKAASSGSVIRMVADETTASESIEINNTITIDGDGHTYTSKKNAFIDASNANLTLYNINLNNCGWNTIHFTAGGTLKISNSTIDNSQGAAIYSNGTLTMTDTIISNCKKSNESGSIMLYGDASISNSTIIDSTGSGIWAYGSSLTISSTVIKDGADTGITHKSGTLTINNSTISGNKSSGIYSDSSDNIIIDNSKITDGKACGLYFNSSATVTATASAFTLNAKGGIRNLGGGKMHLTDCSIDRNRFQSSGDPNELGGGGFLNGENGLMILDRCSITDNLISGTDKGGGGGENKGTLYMNNCTVANNQTHELGGGLNNSGTAYILNSTFTGNSSLCTDPTRSAEANNGGAIGVFSEGKVYTVNTLFSVNYCMNLSTNEPIPSDIGIYSGSTGTAGTNSNVHIYNCIYNTIAKNNKDTSTADIDSCNSISSGRDIFNTFATGYILKTDGSFNYDTSFERPALTLTEKNKTYAALLKKDSKALTGGCITYFSVINLDNDGIIAGYLNTDNQFKPLNGKVLSDSEAVSEEDAIAEIEETLGSSADTTDEPSEETPNEETDETIDESEENTEIDTTEDVQEKPADESYEDTAESDTTDITVTEDYISLYAPTAYDSYKVGIYQNEASRIDGVVGAIGPEEENKIYYTITVKDLENGLVNGASIYGDTHEKDKKITIEAIPNEGYNFKQWKIVKYTTDDNGSRKEASTTYINLSEYTITLDANYDVTPVFEPGYNVTFSSDPDSGYYTKSGKSEDNNKNKSGIIAFNITASVETVAQNTTITEFGMDLSTDSDISIDTVGVRLSSQISSLTFSEGTTFKFNATVDEIPYNSFNIPIYYRPYIVIAGTASDTNNSVENDDDSSDSNSTVSSTNNDGTYTAAELFHCNVDSNKWLGGDAEHEADISNTSNDTSSAK